MTSKSHRIHRHNYENKFTVMPNNIAEHEHLSWMSKALLWYMLSRPADWVVYRAQLAQVYKGSKKGNGKDAIDSCFNELIEQRFIIYTPRDEKTGKFIHRYDVYPEEQDEEIKEKIPQPVKPCTDLGRQGLNYPLQRNDYLPSNEKDNNRTKEIVVVPSCLKELKLEEEYLQEISSKLSLEDATLLSQRIGKWTSRDNDMKACRTILRKWDTWDDRSSKQVSEDKVEYRKQKACEVLKDGMEIPINHNTKATVNIYNSYLEIVCSGVGKIFEYIDEAFCHKVNEYLEKTQFKDRIQI